MIRRSLLVYAVLALLAASAEAAVLYAISGDDFGIPRRVNQIDTDTQTVETLFDLGDGTLGYFGLAFGNDRFYTVANDGFGSSTLHTFTFADGGATAPQLVLGQGFTGGLAFAGGDSLYALGSDFAGAAGLHGIDLGAATVSLIDASLGFGLPGGLTWDPTQQLLYALGSDPAFVQTLFSIDPATPGSAVAASDPLGQGIVGGVDYAAGGELFAIGNAQNFSELLSLTLGAGASPLFPLSNDASYTFAGLTSGPAFDIPDANGRVPAAPSLVLLVGGLIGFLASRCRCSAHCRP